MIRRAQAGVLPGEAQVATTSQSAADIAHLRPALEDAVFESFGIATTSLLAMYVVWRGFRRFIWKRPPAPVLRDQSAQLHQLQQSMDVIALEVERISEAQRYTAKLLSEKSGEKVPSIRS